MDYTIIGSAVNLAAPLETRAEAGGLLIGNETHSLVKDWIRAEEQEAIIMKGFHKPCRTFKVKDQSALCQERKSWNLKPSYLDAVLNFPPIFSVKPPQNFVGLCSQTTLSEETKIADKLRHSVSITLLADALD